MGHYISSKREEFLEGQKEKEEEVKEALRNDFVTYAGQISEKLDRDISVQKVAQTCLNSPDIEVYEKTSRGNKYKVKDSE